MRRAILSLIFLVGLWHPLAGAVEATGNQPLVIFFGTNQFQAVNTEAAEVFGVQLKQYNLDAHRNLEKQLSEGLPQDRVEAERLANARLQALDLKLVQQSFQGIALALQWDVRKAPAFVFNEGSQVIYGMTDLAEALKRWQYFRMTQ